MTQQVVNVTEIIDNAKFQKFHWQVLFWCLFVIFFDGYDLVIFSIALPLLLKEWDMTLFNGGILASAALAGMMVGAMIFGSLADKFGRKNIIMVCVLCFSTFTFICAFSKTPEQFALLRFLSGLGIGGVMPNLVALTSEYAPKKSRATMVSVMFSGVSVGGMGASLFGTLFVQKYGWEVLFYFAVVPLFLFPLLWKFLPPSISYLVKENKQEQAKKYLQKVDPTLTLAPNETLAIAANPHAAAGAPTSRAQGSAFSQLFTEGRAFSTLMFWVAFFMCLLVTYTLGSWLPKLMIAAGYSLGASIWFMFALNFGATFGSIIGGYLADRFHLKPVLVAMCTIAAASISGLAFNSPPAVLYTLVAIAGATTIGASILLYSYLAQFYPLHIRTTGIGCASAVGRIGSIVGPIFTGYLLTINLSHTWNFLAIGVAAIITALAMLVLKRV